MYVYQCFYIVSAASSCPQKMLKTPLKYCRIKVQLKSQNSAIIILKLAFA